MTAHVKMSHQPDPLARARFRLSSGVALVEIGGQPALFSQRGEALFALDAPAAVAAAQLGAGCAFDALVAAVDPDGSGGAAARGFVRALLRQWSALGMVEADMVSPSLERGWRQRLQIASVTAEIVCASPALYRRVSPVFAHFATNDDAPRVRFHLDLADGLVLVRRDGAGAAIVSAGEAVPLVKGLLVKEVLAAAPPDIALHAACLAKGTRALLLTGAPGAGKSTLTVALAAAGFGYAADDITLLAPDGRVRGVPFAPAAKPGAWPLLRPMRPDLAAQRVHRRLDDIRVRYLPVGAPPRTDRLDVGWIVHLRRIEGAAPALVPLAPMQALGRLMDEAYSAQGPADLETLQTLIGAAERAEAFDLVYSDLDDAVRVLAGACADA